MVNLGVDYSSPVFFVDKICDIRIRIIHAHGGRFDVDPSFGKSDNADMEVGFELSA